MVVRIDNGKICVSVDTLGAELVSVIGSDGHEYIYQGGHWNGHAPLLFPVCGSLLDGEYRTGGKLYKMPKHGFARRSEFMIERIEDDRLVLSLSPTDAIRAQYPFEFKLTAEYRIEGECLYADFTVENRGEGVMPYSFGWHPAFVLGGEAPIGEFYLDFGVDGPFVMHPLNGGPFLSGEKVDFPLTDGRYKLDEKQIYENDTLILTGTPGEVRLYGVGDIHEVTVTYSDNLPYLCIWKWPESAARYLCIEPWSGTPADGITPECFDTREMSRLAGGSSECFKYSVRFEK